MVSEDGGEPAGSKTMCVRQLTEGLSGFYGREDFSAPEDFSESSGAEQG